MSSAGSAGSAASRGEAARARTERAHELRRNSRESRSTRTAEPEPEDGDTLPAELTQTTTRAEHASRGARRHAESLSETVTLLRDAQLLPAEAICEMIADEADTVTTLVSSHVDQAIGRIIDQSAIPIIGQLMEKIATDAADGEEVDLTRVTENLREELEQRLKIGAEGNATRLIISASMADWYTTRVKRMANQEHPVVVTMEAQIALINESVQTAEEAVEKVTEKAGRVSTEMMSGKSKNGRANSATMKGTPKKVPTGVPVFTQQDLLKLKDAVAELEVHRGSLEYAQQGTANGIQVGRALRTDGGGIAQLMRDFDGSTSQADALREKLGAEGSSATAVEANLSKLMADWTRDTRNSKESLRTVVHAHTGLEPVDSPTKQALSQDLINDLAPLNFTEVDHATDRVLPDPMRPYKVAATLIKHLLRNTENYVELIVVLHAYRYFNIAVNTDCEILTVESVFLDLEKILKDAKTGPSDDEGKTASPTFGVRLSGDFHSEGADKYNSYFVTAFEQQSAQVYEFVMNAETGVPNGVKLTVARGKQDYLQSSVTESVQDRAPQDGKVTMACTMSLLNLICWDNQYLTANELERKRVEIMMLHSLFYELPIGQAIEAAKMAINDATPYSPTVSWALTVGLTLDQIRLNHSDAIKAALIGSEDDIFKCPHDVDPEDCFHALMGAVGRIETVMSQLSVLDAKPGKSEKARQACMHQTAMRAVEGEAYTAHSLEATAWWPECTAASWANPIATPRPTRISGRSCMETGSKRTTTNKRC